MMHLLRWSSAVLVLSRVCVRVVFSKQPAEERPQATSTGVFQDEELLFSQTQQKDNDPDVDIFATSGKAPVSILDICVCLCTFVFSVCLWTSSTP